MPIFTKLGGTPGVIRGFNFERTISSRSQVKFLFFGGPWSVCINVGECMDFNV